MRVRVRPGQRVEKGEPLVDVSSAEVVRAAGALAAADLRLAAHDERRQRLAPLVDQGLARAQELSELDASANGVAIQSLKLEHEGWERDVSVVEPTEPTLSDA